MKAHDDGHFASLFAVDGCFIGHLVYCHHCSLQVWVGQDKRKP